LLQNCIVLRLVSENLFVMRILVVVLLILLTNWDLYSQINIGVKGGFTLVNTRFNVLDSDSEFKPSYLFGLNAQTRLSEKWDVDTDLIFIQKGNSDVRTLRLNTIVFRPLLFYKFGKVGVGVGPEIGYLLSAKGIVMGIKFNDQNYNEGGVDIGIDGGIRYNISNRIQIALIYNHGLSNVDSNNGDEPALPSDPTGPTQKEVKEKNFGFRLSLRYDISRFFQ